MIRVVENREWRKVYLGVIVLLAWAAMLAGFFFWNKTRPNEIPTVIQSTATETRVASPTFTATPEPTATPIDSGFLVLEQTLAEKVANYTVSGKFTLSVTDLQTGQTIGVGNNERVLSGCTMNFFVLLTAVKEVQAGTLTLDQVDDLIARTIYGSNALTAHTLYQIIGQGDVVAGVQKVDRTIKDLGLKSTQIDHPPAYPDETLGIDENNWISATEANLALTKLYHGEILDPHWSAYLLEKMIGVKSGLNSLTEYGTGGTVSHKNGFFWDSGGWIDNDIAVVRFERNGKKYAYAISFFSSQVASKYADIALGQGISVEVWNYFDHKYQ